MLLAVVEAALTRQRTWEALAIGAHVRHSRFKRAAASCCHGTHSRYRFPQQRIDERLRYCKVGLWCPYVQLAASDNPAYAEQEWARLSKQHTSLNGSCAAAFEDDVRHILAESSKNLRTSSIVSINYTVSGPCHQLTRAPSDRNISTNTPPASSPSAVLTST